MFLIMKRGFYYRPGSAGYTARPSEAGRYTLEDAEREKAMDPKNITIVRDLAPKNNLRLV